MNNHKISSLFAAEIWWKITFNKVASYSTAYLVSWLRRCLCMCAPRVLDPFHLDPMHLDHMHLDHMHLDPMQPRPFPPRPYAPRPFPPRPYAPRPYAPRPYAPRPYASRPYAPRPYAPTPYALRPSRCPAHVILLLILKKCRQCKLGESDLHLISPKTPAPQY